MTKFSNGTRQNLSNQFLDDVIHKLELDRYLPIFHAEQFFTEKIFYDQWIKICTARHPFDYDAVYNPQNSSVSLRFRLKDYPSGEYDIIFLYTLTPDRKRYDLEIIHDENSIFLRTAEQGIKEWCHNYYANDLTDAAGNYYFPGDPIQD